MTNKGWKNDSARHALASKGIKSGTRTASFSMKPSMATRMKIINERGVAGLDAYLKNYKEKQEKKAEKEKNKAPPEMTEKSKELENYLHGFHGTEHYYKTTFGGAMYTDGMRGLADKAEAYWLIDDIAIFSKKKDFEIWTLTVDNKNKAVLEMREDSNAPVLVKNKISFTDFPPGQWKFYKANGVILLPSEY